MLLFPRASPYVAPPAPVLDSVGAGATVSSTTATTAVSWSHTIGVAANAVIAGFSFHDISGPATVITSITATCGGQPMSTLGYELHPATTFSREILFGLLINQLGASNMSGAQTVTVTVVLDGADTTECMGNTLSFDNVHSFGTFANINGTTSSTNENLTLSVYAPLDNSVVVQMFVLGGVVSGTQPTIASYNQTTGWSALATTSTDAVLIGYAPGGGIVNFSAAQGGVNTAIPWTGIGAVLNP